jgi:hypothetical protein
LRQVACGDLLDKTALNGDAKERCSDKNFEKAPKRENVALRRFYAKDAD